MRFDKTAHQLGLFPVQTLNVCVCVCVCVCVYILHAHCVSVIVLDDCYVLAGSSAALRISTDQSSPTADAQHIPGCIHI